MSKCHNKLDFSVCKKLLRHHNTIRQTETQGYTKHKTVLDYIRTINDTV